MYEKEIEKLSYLAQYALPIEREALDTAIALMRVAEPKDAPAEHKLCLELAAEMIRKGQLSHAAIVLNRTRAEG